MRGGGEVAGSSAEGTLLAPALGGGEGADPGTEAGFSGQTSPHVSLVFSSSSARVWCLFYDSGRVLRL